RFGAPSPSCPADTTLTFGCFTGNILTSPPFVLATLNDTVTASHRDCVVSGDADFADHQLRDTAIAIGADLGIGTPPSTCVASLNPPRKVDNPACFTFTFPAQVTVVTPTTTTTTTTSTTT